MNFCIQYFCAYCDGNFPAQLEGTVYFGKCCSNQSNYPPPHPEFILYLKHSCINCHYYLQSNFFKLRHSSSNCPPSCNISKPVAVMYQVITNTDMRHHHIMSRKSLHVLARSGLYLLNDKVRQALTEDLQIHLVYPASPRQGGRAVCRSHYRILS